jgi:hypothetical protein
VRKCDGRSTSNGGGTFILLMPSLFNLMILRLTNPFIRGESMAVFKMNQMLILFSWNSVTSGLAIVKRLRQWNKTQLGKIGKEV